MTEREAESENQNYEEEQEQAQAAPESGVGWANEVDATDDDSERAEK